MVSVMLQEECLSLHRLIFFPPGTVVKHFKLFLPLNPFMESVLKIIFLMKYLLREYNPVVNTAFLETMPTVYYALFMPRNYFI
jgi:hypothetical protein